MLNPYILLASEEHKIVPAPGSIEVQTKYGNAYQLLIEQNGITINSHYVGIEKSRSWRTPYEDLFASIEKNGEVGRIIITNNHSGNIFLDNQRIARYETIEGRFLAFTIKNNGLESCKLPLDYFLEKNNQFSFDNLYKNIHDLVGKIEPCTKEELLKNPIFKDCPPKRFDQALSLLLHRGWVKPDNNWQLTSHPYP